MQGRLNDAQVISASLRDPALFRDVFERHHDDVRRYLQRRSGIETGEELAAQTFEEAFRIRSRFDPAFSNARPWLMGIATNLLRHHYRAEAAGCGRSNARPRWLRRSPRMILRLGSMRSCCATSWPGRSRR